MTELAPNVAAKVEKLLNRYETKRSSILPILHTIQEEYRCISEEHVDLLHSKYGLDRIHVKEVITFYDIYKQKKLRKYHLRFCNNITCMMLGSRECIGKIKKIIAAQEKEMGEDAPFGIEEFPCLGKCDGAPVMLVNKDREECVTVDNVEEVLAKYAPVPKGL